MPKSNFSKMPMMKSGPKGDKKQSIPSKSAPLFGRTTKRTESDMQPAGGKALRKRLAGKAL